MNEWRTLAVEDLAANTPAALATGPFGSAVSAKHFVDNGTPMIRGSNLSTDVGVRLDDDEVVFLPSEVVGRFERSIVVAGDLVFTCWGTIGQIGLIDGSCRFDRYIVSNKQMKLTPNPEIVESRFLYYALSSPDNLDQVQRQAIGSAVPGFNLGQLRQIVVAVPSLPTQRAISSILKAFDDLIDNNLRRIEILEEMAQAVYREWFVNFRFPGHEDVPLVDSPLGPIPDGWTVSTLGAESTVVMGQSPKSEFYNDEGAGLPFHQGVTHFGSLFPEHRTHCTVETRIAEAGDTLVSVRAPVGRINFADTRMVIGRGLAAIRATDESPGFHFRQLRHVFREEDSMGGGTIYKAITKGDLLGISWLVPPSDMKATFDSLERPMFSLMANLTRQNANLRSTRDLLLPKLVSGEIDVSELDIETEWLAS